MLITNRTAPLSTRIAEALEGAEACWIATAYVSPVGCELLDLRRLAGRIPVRVAVGRIAREGTSPGTLRYLRDLHELAQNNGGGVRVSDPPFHSKIFLVVGASDDAHTWIGSSNLSRHGLEAGVEATVELPPGALAEAVADECRSLWEAGAPLPQAEIPISERVVVSRGTRWARLGAKEQRKPTELLAAEESLPEEAELDDVPRFCVSLAPRGFVPRRSGPNWWNGGGRVRDPNEAYIPLRKRNVELAKAVFGAVRPDTPFKAVTHDGQIISMQLEGATERGGTIAKNIASRGDKTIFGRWLLRDVLDLAEQELLTTDQLDQYGRREICFYRVGTDPSSGSPIVYMDFSARGQSA